MPVIELLNDLDNRLDITLASMFTRNKSSGFEVHKNKNQIEFFNVFNAVIREITDNSSLRFSKHDSLIDKIGHSVVGSVSGCWNYFWDIEKENDRFNSNPVRLTLSIQKGYTSRWEDTGREDAWGSDRTEVSEIRWATTLSIFVFTADGKCVKYAASMPEPLIENSVEEFKRINAKKIFGMTNDELTAFNQNAKLNYDKNIASMASKFKYLLEFALIQHEETPKKGKEKLDEAIRDYKN